MAKKTIGLCYFFDNKSNSGIVNYVYNIVAGLKTLDEDVKPKIIVFHSENAPTDYLKTIDYPYIQFYLFRSFSKYYLIRKVNSLIKKVFAIDLYKKYKYFDKIDCLYPYFDFLDQGFRDAKNKVHWLVDFNNKAFPEHYDDGGLVMNQYQQMITSVQERVILSSQSLFEELKVYYPNYKCDIKILRFASSLPILKDVEIGPLLQKFNIDVPFFMSPNQFWEHKNQDVVLNAIIRLKNDHPDLVFKVLFTGSLEVNRGKGLYVNKLKQKIAEFRLESHILFLGILDRQEQLLLMKKSVALIQPSLYEGWSTLVEEAKALNKFIILSDLPVHREQIKLNVDFFNPHDDKELANKMYNNLKTPPHILDYDYADNIKEFGKSIIESLDIS